MFQVSFLLFFFVIVVSASHLFHFLLQLVRGVIGFLVNDLALAHHLALVEAARPRDRVKVLEKTPQGEVDQLVMLEKVPKDQVCTCRGKLLGPGGTCGQVCGGAFV